MFSCYSLAVAKVCGFSAAKRNKMYRLERLYHIDTRAWISYEPVRLHANLIAYLILMYQQNTEFLWAFRDNVSITQLPINGFLFLCSAILFQKHVVIWTLWQRGCSWTNQHREYHWSHKSNPSILSFESNNRRKQICLRSIF